MFEAPVGKKKVVRFYMFKVICQILAKENCTV